MTRNASEHRDIPEHTLFKYYIKVLNFTLLRNIAKVICLKAIFRCQVCQTNAALHAVNKLVLTMSRQLNTPVKEIDLSVNITYHDGNENDLE